MREIIESELGKIEDEINEAFAEIQMVRTPFVLKNFVLGQHDTIEQQYAQCVLEMQIKWDALRRAKLNRRKMELDLEDLKQEKETSDCPERVQLDIELKQIDIEEQDRAALGALREFKTLYHLWKGFPKRYTREDLNEAQPEYWDKRLTRQANQDLLATGRVQKGNQEALRQIGKAPVPELDHVRDVERRYLEMSEMKVLIAVPTEEKAEDGLSCLEGLEFPPRAQVKLYNVWGRSTADAYNDAAMQLLKDDADFLLTVEDDTFPPPNALICLMQHFDGADSRRIVGAWYPKRTTAREGAPIVVRNGHRQPLMPDDKVHEVYTIPMGCTLFPREIFLELNFPWFVRTEHLTQDSFFSQKARDADYQLLCDTSIRCKHVDRETERVFE